MDTWAFLSVLLAVTHYGKKHLKLKMKKKHDFPHPTQVNYYSYTFVAYAVMFLMLAAFRAGNQNILRGKLWWWYYTLLRAVSGQSTIKWCTISEAEESKCKAMSQAFTSASIRPAIQCVRVSSKAECAQKLTVSLSVCMSVIHLCINI